ncbi:hypothetical protein ACQ4LE_007089, partial [Meloidogyne hapla]
MAEDNLNESRSENNEEVYIEEENSTTLLLTSISTATDKQNPNQNNEIVKWGEVDDEKQYKNNLDEKSIPYEKENAELSQEGAGIKNNKDKITTTFSYFTVTTEENEFCTNEVPVDWGEVDNENEYKNSLDGSSDSEKNEDSRNKNINEKEIETTLTYATTTEENKEVLTTTETQNFYLNTEFPENDYEMSLDGTSNPEETENSTIYSNDSRNSEEKENEENTTLSIHSTLKTEENEEIESERDKNQNLTELKRLIEQKKRNIKKLNEDIKNMKINKNNSETKMLGKKFEEDGENSLEEIRELQKDEKITNLIKDDERIKQQHLADLKRIVEQKRKIVQKLKEDVENL